MYKVSLVSTKGDTLKTFVTSSAPQSRIGSEGVEIRGDHFTLMGSFNVIIEEVPVPTNENDNFDELFK